MSKNEDKSLHVIGATPVLFTYHMRDGKKYTTLVEMAPEKGLKMDAEEYRKACIDGALEAVGSVVCESRFVHVDEEVIIPTSDIKYITYKVGRDKS